MTKGVAICLVMLYHFVFDLTFFTAIPVNVGSWSWRLVALTGASLFVFTSGLSIAWAYYTNPHNAKSRLHRRSIILLAIACCISLITWVAFPEEPIFFGILHCLSMCGFLAPFFFRFGMINIIFGIAIIASSFLIETIHSKHLWLLPFGITPMHFYTLDYFPLIPWFGLFLWGITFAHCMQHYQKYVSTPQPNTKIIKTLTFLGKRTLMLYLIHQPIIFLLLFLTGLFAAPS